MRTMNIETVFLMYDKDKNNYHDMHDSDRVFYGLMTAIEDMGRDGYRFCGTLTEGMNFPVYVFQRER